VVWAEAGELMLNEAGDSVALSGIAQDITERKRVEEDLRMSEARAQAMLHAIPDLMFRIDRQGVFLDHKGEQKDLYTQSELIIGKRARDILPPELVDLLELKICITLETDTLQTFDYQLPIPGQGLRDYEARMVANGADEVISIVRDVTERKRIEEQIRQLNAELEQRVEERTRELRLAQEQLIHQEKLALLGQLANGVGHELRNPLGVINSAVYYLKLVQPDAEDNIRQYHSMIEQEVRIAEKIINDLLDFNRNVTADRERVSVSELVQHVLSTIPVPQSVEVTLKLPDDLPMIFVDNRQIQQVLGNLILNAYQAMRTSLQWRQAGLEVTPEGGTLTISARKQQQMVSISVQDSGVGIPPENMLKLFEPLFTTRAKGIGMGLAISRKLMEANYGRIEVESEPGKGSTFTLVLPIHSR
jgi:PAS domain S-box-containing protein